jgi:flagellar hook capping protein FlgD
VNVTPWDGAEVPVMFRASVAVVDTPKASGIESVYVTVLGDIENRFPLAKSDVEGEYVIPVNSEIPLPPGEQEVSFSVVDMAGNETKRAMIYSVVAEAEAALSIMNFPNPFPPGGITNIRYSLPEEAQNGKIVIFDAGGDMVFFKDLNNGELERGEHTFQWDGRDLFGNILARGIYFCRLWVDMETTDEDEVSKIAIR